MREQRKIDAAVAEYDAYMSFGQKALATKNYKGAISAFQEASRVMPGDPRAAAFLKQAQVAAQAGAKTSDDPKKKDELKKKVDAKKDEIKKKDDKKDDKKKAEASDPKLYLQYMNAGAKAFKAKDYDDAVKWFSAAQKLMPDDPLPGQYLKQAQKLLNESNPKKKKMSWIVPEERWRYEPPAVLASPGRLPFRGTKTRADAAL
jgi:tetratricopeptide (TPR) repeat protein